MEINLREKSLKEGIEIAKVDLKITNIDESFNNFRFIQISDLHFGNLTKINHIKKTIRLVNNLNPNLVIITGDLIHSGGYGFHHRSAIIFSHKLFKLKSYLRNARDKIKELSHELREINASESVLAVFGNHDHMEGLFSLKKNTENFINYLNNKSIVISKGESSISFSGIDDLKLGKPDIQKTIKELEENKKAINFKVLLSHNPDITKNTKKDLVNKFDLMLSGHTHGGQICLLPQKPLLTQTKQREHVSGLSKFNNTFVYVNRGIGYGGLPIRIFCPPEITVFEIKTK